MATTKPRRTAACNPELEASIDEAPDDAERYWIYGDWLESQGDPRGQVIAAARTSRKRERALLEKYGAQLLGPLARIKGAPGAAPLRWRYGFIERARLRRRSATPSLAEQIELLLAHPSARFLRHLSLRTPDHGDDTPGYRQVLELAARRAPRTLASLALGEGGESIGDLGDALGALPSLRALCLFADTAHLDPKSTEGVVALSVQRIRAREPALLQACAWPSLRHLELHYDYVGAAWSEGPPLPLGEDLFPRLRSVTVHFSRAWRGEVLLQLFDVEHLRRWSALRLDTIFLGADLDAWFFRNADALGGLGELRLAAQELGVSRERADRLREALPNVVFGEIPIADPFEDAEPAW